jgi:hypothetical protein
MGSQTRIGASGPTDAFQSDFKSLLKAVQSGDLASAQSAVDSLKGEMDGTSATYSPSSASSSGFSFGGHWVELWF